MWGFDSPQEEHTTTSFQHSEAQQPSKAVLQPGERQLWQ